MSLDYILGLDLGTVRDHAAMVLLARQPPQIIDPHKQWETDDIYHQVVWAEQVPLGHTYPDIVTHLEEIVTSPILRGNVNVVMDRTGVGIAVLHMLQERQALGDVLWSVTFTSGQAERRNGMTFSVPKKDLVGATLVLLQKGLLACDEEQVKDANRLRKEMLEFVMKKKPDQNAFAYEAEGKNDHDDMVMALCLACWLSGKIPMSDYSTGYSKGFAPYKVSEGDATYSQSIRPNLGFNRPER